MNVSTCINLCYRDMSPTLSTTELETGQVIESDYQYRSGQSVRHCVRLFITTVFAVGLENKEKTLTLAT